MTRNLGPLFAREAEILDDAVPVRVTGRVARVIGLVAECEGLALAVGSTCRILPSYGSRPVEAEVVGFKEDRALLMPLGEFAGVKRFDPVVSTAGQSRVGVGDELLGRVLDARGHAIDGGPPVLASHRYAVYGRPPRPLTRPRITEPLGTGVRSIDGLLTIGKGQRIGLFAGSGVGKSVLMGMIARNTSATVSVIALVGERGREVKDFLERDLGPEGRRKSVVVVATSDEPALLRVKAPFVASAVAEYFRDQGHDVMLLMDSITRMSNAQREIGLSAGEPPATKGYPPSVFAMLPKLLERSGRDVAGSITGIYTVLVEGDDVTEPIADTSRSILDGHVWLSRELAARGQYPAVDVLGSISRLMIDVTAPEHQQAAGLVRRLLATYQTSEDLINIGAYVKGSNPEIDLAIASMPQIREFLRQAITERVVYDDAIKALMALALRAGTGPGASPPGRPVPGDTRKRAAGIPGPGPQGPGGEGLVRI